MDERSLKALEFFQVLEALKEFSVSLWAKGAA
jgi:hypothetical protein